MQIRNQKIIDAIVAKANRDCPGALAMIGIYGSFLTGDTHEKSDLDLLILINDERGYCLSHTFLLEDDGIGHDLYCTTWEKLESDARFQHPHISKLMDSKIIYCADDASRSRLEALRQQALSANTREAAKAALQEAESWFARAMVSSDLARCRSAAGKMLYKLMEAIALANGVYYRLGTRRVFQEIDSMARKPENFRSLVMALVSAREVSDLNIALLPLLQSVDALFEESLPTPEVFPGTYEEMFSNWRNKMYLAAEENDSYLAFDSMCGLNSMLEDLGYPHPVLDKYQPDDLPASAKAYDEILQGYRKLYKEADIAVQSYADVDSFIETYLKKKA